MYRRDPANANVAHYIIRKYEITRGESFPRDSGFDATRVEYALRVHPMYPRTSDVGTLQSFNQMEEEAVCSLVLHLSVGSFR